MSHFLHGIEALLVLTTFEGKQCISSNSYQSIITRCELYHHMFITNLFFTLSNNTSFVLPTILISSYYPFHIQTTMRCGGTRWSSWSGWASAPTPTFPGRSTSCRRLSNILTVLTVLYIKATNSTWYRGPGSLLFSGRGEIKTVHGPL